MNKILSRLSSRSGQSIVEAIVALSILTIGLLGILALLNRSFSLNRVASTDAQATYLAAEGIEITKNLIDHDVYCFLNGGGCPNPYQNPGFGTSCFIPAFPQGYELDYTTTGCPSKANGAPRPLYLDPVTHLYGYAVTPIRTSFTRRVRITWPNWPSTNEIDVQSIVSWTTGAATQNIVLDDHFYAWRL